MMSLGLIILGLSWKGRMQEGLLLGFKSLRRRRSVEVG